MTKPDKKNIEMQNTNVAQAAYYNQTDGGSLSEVNGFATNLWRKMRHRAFVSVSAAERDRVYEAHRMWLGDISDKKVLDLGCGHGSALSVYLAENAKCYHALDLSQNEINSLKQSLPESSSVHTHVGDFLNDDFQEADFDIIYAHSVLHHFAHIEVALDRVHDRLAPSGRVISYDPLQVWLPVRLLRALYRPLQTDSEWEWPFTRKTIDQIAGKFEIIDQFGVFNRAKWALIIGIIRPSWGKAFGDKWFRTDLADRSSHRHQMKSLHISLHLKKR
jgi:SAM-dependent methyltransferase